MGLLERVRRWAGRGRLPVWWHAAYRLPLPGLESARGLEPRRADLAMWFLLERGVLARHELRTPEPVAWADLARAHGAELLESLSQPATLARIFAADAEELPVDELLHSIRLACGGTLAAAREALARGGPTLNLLGGFHHAGPDRAGGLCAVNDLAVALAALRAEGLAGKVVVLDLDAHPPDGTVACLRGDGDAWIGSLGPEDWDVDGPLDRATVPVACGDDDYLAALAALLERMPRPSALTFVVAGGDVLAGDRLGRLGLTLDGARHRDLMVADALHDAPSVWLPGGGYHRDAWRLLVGTALVLAKGSLAPVPADVDPLEAHFALVAGALDKRRLAGRRRRDGGAAAGDDAHAAPAAPAADDGLSFTLDDVADALGMPGAWGTTGAAAAAKRLCGFYSAEGLEYAFFRYGLLEYVRRLGYTDLRVAVDATGSGDRMRLLGRVPAGGAGAPGGAGGAGAPGSASGAGAPGGASGAGAPGSASGAGALGGASGAAAPGGASGAGGAGGGSAPVSASGAGGAEHVLVEAVLQLRPVADAEMLYVHWLTLRDPRARFSDARPALPGQDAPGLGLSREAGHMLARMAARLGAAGVAFRPAWYHTAYAARAHFRFVDPERQGRFEALARALVRVPLREATLAVAGGDVLLDGAPYAWEADEMAHWLDAASGGGGEGAAESIGATPSPEWAARVQAERDRVRFTRLASPAGAG
jgi:acetoin utilization deacetylase AcuC-like enzyme